MGNIKTLNFKVILDDAAFNKQIKSDIQAAENLNISLSNYLNLRRRAQSGRYISKAEEQTAIRLSNIKRAQAVNEERIRRAKTQTLEAQIRLNSAVAQQNRHYTTQKELLSKIQGLVYGSATVMMAQRFVRELANISGEFEKQKVALEAITQDTAAADKLYSQIKALAVESPFTFKELISYTKQLSAFSIPTDELYETTKMLADVSAGLGVGLDRIILAYGQIRSASFLRGQEVRQLTEAGIPILNMLAEKFSKIEGSAISAAQVFNKISAREVPFEMVEEVFKEMTSEGGKFYKMQETLAETLSGKISNLTDAYENMLSEIGEQKDGVLKGTVDWLRKLIDNYEETGKTIIWLTSIYGAFKATSIATEAIAKIKSIYKYTSAVAGKLDKDVFSVLIARGLKSVNVYALIAAAVAALGVGIWKLVTAKTAEKKVNDAIADNAEENVKRTAEEVAQLDNLYAKLRMAKEGTEEYDAAKQKIASTYAAQINQLKQESEGVLDVANSYDRLKESIISANNELAYNNTVITVQKVYDNERNEILKAAQKYYDNIVGKYKTGGDPVEYNKRVAKGLGAIQLILGTITEEEYLREYPEAIQDIEGWNNYGSINGGHTEGYLGLLVRRMRENDKANEAAKKRIADFYGISEEEAEKAAEIIKEKYIEVAQGVLAKHNITSTKGSYGLWIDYDSAHRKEYSDYVKTLRDNWEDVKQQIADAGNEMIDTAPLKKQKKIIEDIAAAYGISLEKSSDGTSSRTRRNPYTEAIEGLKELIDLIKQYNDLVEVGMSPDTAKTLVFGLDYEGPTDTETAINDFYSKALGKPVTLDFSFGSKLPEEQLKEFGATEQQLQDLEKGTDEALDYRKEQIEKTVDLMKEAKDLAEQQKTTEEEIAEIEKKRVNIEALDMDESTKKKAIDELNEQLSELKGNVNNINFTEFWQTLNDLDESGNFKIARDYIAEAQTLYDKIKGGDIGVTEKKKDGTPKGVKITKTEAEQLGLSELVIEQMFGSNEYLVLTAKQVETLGEKTKELLESWRQSNVPISTFFKSLKNGAKENETEIEYLKRLREEGTAASNAISDLGSTLSEIANTAGLENIGSILSSTGSAAGSILENYASIKAIIKGKKEGEKFSQQDNASIAKSSLSIFSSAFSWISSIYRIVSNIIEEQRQLNEELARANQEAQKAIEIARDARAVDMYEGIFGTNELGQYQEYVKIAKKYRDSVLNAQSTLNSKYTTLEGEGLGGMWRQTMNTKGVYADTRNWWQKLWGSTNGLTSLNDFLESNGGLNYDNLKAYYDAYSSYLSEENKLLVEGLLSDWEQYEEAIEQIDSYAESIFGNTADNIADAWLDAFLETGNAYADLGDLVSDVSEQMAKDVVKAMLLDNIFTDDAKQQIVEYLANGDVDKAAEYFDNLVSASEGLLPSVQAFLEKMEPYMEEGKEGTSDLEDSIEGVTEDTAELIASYINGIRADVSIAKLQRATIIEQIKALTASQIPSLTEYLNTISAHTFDIAKSTQDILSTLESAITTEAGFPSFRVLEE